MSRVVLHIDMDAFFAQVEQQKNPALRGKPVIVGGDSIHRGVVAACSYEARKYGIHSAMSAVQARKLCPQAVFIGGNLTNYVYLTSRILQILHRYSPIVEPTSIDEAFLDISNSTLLFGSPRELAMALKAEIRLRLKLTCSIGLAENKLLAKTASELEKPDGLSTLWPGELESKFFPLPVRKLYGVGEKTEKVLNDWGIRTIGELAAFPEGPLTDSFGVVGSHLKLIANGLDDTPVIPADDQPVEKSMSHEHTLDKDTSDFGLLRALLVTLTDKVVMRMRRDKRLARTIRLKLRYSDFNRITREVTLDSYTDQVDVIADTAFALIPRESVGTRKVRLIGVGVAGLISSGMLGQLHLFSGDSDERTRHCWDAVEKIRDKFGNDSISPAGGIDYFAME